MKDGTKGSAKSGATKSAESALPFVVIPFPPGLSSVVAEEPLTLPQFTPRELDVAAWMAEGKLDAEIAHILRIGIETVKTHVSSLLDKTNVENRTAFGAWVWRNRFAAQFHQRRPRKPVKYS